MSRPTFVIADEDKIIQQQYNGRRISVYVGKVKISDVQGWVDNPRIEVMKKAYLSKTGPHVLSQDEIFDLMKNDPDVKLADLRDDIIKNGLRKPITLTYEGKLLDGNRRFFSVKFALEELPPTYPYRSDLEVVPCFVLLQDAPVEDEEAVLVEENFSASHKVEWPDYVKARKICAAFDEGKLSEDAIAKKFGWPKRKVQDSLRINEIIQDFMAIATEPKDPEDETGGGFGMSDTQAEDICNRSYQYFNEAHKSFRDPLKKEPEFKIQFFKWLAEGRFHSFPEVRIAYKAWGSPEAKAALSNADDPNAAKSAKAIIDYNDRVIKSAGEIEGRITNFTKFLEGMSVQQLKTVPADVREKLHSALKTVDGFLSTLG